MAALIYQSAWTRQFALVFGTSELAVATVLAAYMGGLALGARSIQRWLPRLRRPVQCYAWLELGIAVTALFVVPLCLRAAEFLLTHMFGGQAEPAPAGAASNSWFYLLAAMLTLLLPTALMGATLPLLVRDGVQEEGHIGSRIGMLYACNTAGAVFGALLTALLLLPQFGLRGTVWVAASINLLVGGFAWMLAVTAAPTLAQPTVADGFAEPSAIEAAAPDTASGPFWILPLMLLSGAVSFMQEVLWTRLLVRVVGSTIQSFGIMVASFLAGIALGGAMGARLARRRDHVAVCWSLAQLAIAVALICSWYALLAWAPLPQSAPARMALGLVLLLPMSMAIGVTYPLAVRLLAGGIDDAPAASARLYSWNTCGAILGALAGGFWLIPALRYEGAIRFSVTMSLLLAALAAILQSRTRWRVAPLLLLVLAVGWLFRPHRPDELLGLSPLRNAGGTLLHYDVGRTADVVVMREQGHLELRTSGLPEAATPVKGAPPLANVEAWMPMLAVLARPATRDMLIVGLGSGNVTQAVPPSVRHIDVIELEPKVIAANRAVAALRASDPLADPRLHLIVNDARAALALTERRYGAIVSQPSHPWTAGASHLYTREFMQQAHDHLIAGGVFVQWMGAEFVDGRLLRSLVATLGQVYREVRVYRPSATTLLFMASDLPLDLEHRPAELRSALDRQAPHYARWGLNAPEDLVAALVMENDASRHFASGAQPITDDMNRLATADVYARGRGLDGGKLSALLAPHDPLVNGASFIYSDLRSQLSFEYLWRHSMLKAGTDGLALERMNRMSELLGDTDGQALQYAGAAASTDSDEAAIKDWDAVAASDQALATTPWTAQRSLQAAKLRVEWRLHAQDPELRQHLGDEALAIVDRVEAAQPDVFWHALRAASAAEAGSSDALLESAALFCSTADALRGKLTDAESRQLRVRAQELLPLLGKLEGDRRVEGARVTAVEEQLRSLALFP